MKNNKFITESELRIFGMIENLSQKAEALLNHQKDNWDLVKNNFSALENVEIKKFEFDNYYINAQFNPSRITSSSAKVDKKSIANRACFLCEENLPDVQKGINYNDKYIILVNPYPIFKQHLTIPHHTHIPQNIDDALSDMLDLSYDLRNNFFIFYNGPKCGASAPDHLHFQAGAKNSIPLENYYKELIEKHSSVLLKDEIVEAYQIEDKFLNFLSIRSQNKQKIIKLTRKVIQQLQSYKYSKEEPLLNIISLFDEDNWNVFIFPRKAHRPKQFFAEDDSQLLISPASGDMAGLLIVPRKEDFEKLTKDDVRDIYSQVLYTN